MTDEELEETIREMEEMLGELPSPIHQPRIFAHYVKLYKYYKHRNIEDVQVQQSDT